MFGSQASKTSSLLWKECAFLQYMGVSKNNGTPKSSILIGFAILNHPFWGTPIFGNIHMSDVSAINEKPFFMEQLDHTNASLVVQCPYRYKCSEDAFHSKTKNAFRNVRTFLSLLLQLT